MAAASPGVLYVVATPIGNLEDITFRAVRILRETAVIAAEDTRVTAKLTRRYDIHTPLVAIRGKSAKRNLSRLVEQLSAGDDVALVTDAGTPSVSDPGYDLVTAARAAGIRVSPIPGPSALAAAISVAGLFGEGVRFFGFLPRAGRRRRDLLSTIACERALSVIYESPRRLAATLSDLVELCDREGAVLREITKINEEIVTGPLSALVERYGSTTVKGEVTLMVEGLRGPGERLSDDELRQLIQRELAAGHTTRDIAASLSGGLEISRKTVYKMALEEQAKQG